ncbi:hypothetical protein ACFYPG_03865 [Micromonospora sp. NPDC005553]|uniref:hypothetical protein n=1 Tax=unclassified Micromonospora TaxID=2617518 RepID=UPI0033B43F59
MRTTSTPACTGTGGGHRRPASRRRRGTRRRLWVNPDCGLKTRGYAEVEQALTRVVAAAAKVRSTLP